MTSSIATAVREGARSTRQSWLGHGGWVDRLLGSDPGLNRLRNALHCIVTIAVVLEAEWLFVHFTGALQTKVAGPLPSTLAAKTALMNHEVLLIAMLFGSLIGMISAFAVMDPRAKGQFVTMLFLPVPMISGLALGLTIGGHRVVSLVMIAVVLTFGTYLRRFGSRGVITGMVLFIGYFLGYFLHVVLNIDDLGWLSAEIGVGLLVALAIRFTFFFPHPDKALARTQRSYEARARRLAHLALDLFDVPHTTRGGRRLHRQLVRLNEAALMIDAQLGDPGSAVDGMTAQLLHQRLFDVELSLSNIARSVEAMAGLDLPANQRSEVRWALLDIIRWDAHGARRHAVNLVALLSSEPSQPIDDTSLIIVHRFTESVSSLTKTLITDGEALEGTNGGASDFQPSVTLFGGWLPGSSMVSAMASVESGGIRIGDRIRLAPYSRTAIQIAVAVGFATLLGVQISSARFYWAVLAAFITFMGTNNAGEQVLKACHRVAGTVVGIGLGSLAIDALGSETYLSIAAILIALFFGLYFLRIGYVFMVVGVTVAVAQIYRQLGEFSTSLLLVRLEETALGATVTVIVVMTVLPLRTRKVVRVALRAHVEALGQLIQQATAELLRQEHDADLTLRAATRILDAAHQTLVAASGPLYRDLAGRVDESIGQMLRLAAATRHYARDLVVDVGAGGSISADAGPDFEHAGATLCMSVGAMVKTLTDHRSETYTRSAALFDRVERRVETTGVVVGWDELALRHFVLLDGALAEMAEGLGLKVTDYDGTQGSVSRRQRVPGIPNHSGVAGP